MERTNKTFGALSPFAPRKDVLSRSESRHCLPSWLAAALLLANFAMLAGCGGSDVSKLAAQLSDADEDVRYAAAKELEDLGPLAKPAVPALAAALSDDDPKIRYRAAKALSKIGSGLAEAVPALAKALEDKERDVRYYSAKALDDAGAASESVVTELASVLETETDPDVRYYVVKAIKNAGLAAAPATPALDKAAKDSDPRVREVAQAALKKIQR